jgi:spore germination protein GerM
VVLVGAVLAVAMLAGCGLPGDGSPREIAEEQVPVGLLEPSASDATDTPNLAGEPVTLFFYNSTRRLEPVETRVPEASPTSALNALIEYELPSDGGLTNSVPREVRVLGVEEAGDNLVTVTLSQDFTGIQGEGQLLAFAQLVWTLAEVDGVDQVQFRIEQADGSIEEEPEILTDSGNQTGPVQPLDYSSVAPLD